MVSYKLRRGRVSASHRAALAAHGHDFGLGLDIDLTDPTAVGGAQVVDFAAVFGRRAPVVFEIGFGMGEATLAMALADPSRDVLAIDVHTPGVGALVREAAAAQARNLRVAQGDAVLVLHHLIEPCSLDEVRVYFPDPWPKTRHHKRRLVDAEFVALVASRLRVGGRLHLATDWADYGEQMLAVTASDPHFVNRHAGPAPRPASRPVTRFESQALDAGRAIVDIILERVGEPPIEADGAGGPIEVVAAAIVDDLRRPSQVLAARRIGPAEVAGLWELPGGKREPGEHPHQALHRELGEELGIEVELGLEVAPPDGAAAWPIRPGVVMRLWWAQLTAAEPQCLGSHDELRWLPLGRGTLAEAVAWLDADRPIAELLDRLAAMAPGS